jgi:hypothetical protein
MRRVLSTGARLTIWVCLVTTPYSPEPGALRYLPSGKVRTKPRTATSRGSPSSGRIERRPAMEAAVAEDTSRSSLAAARYLIHDAMATAAVPTPSTAPSSEAAKRTSASAVSRSRADMVGLGRRRRPRARWPSRFV